MKIRIYERPAEDEDEYGEWEVSYDEYHAETAERTGGDFETFTWLSWDHGMTARPFAWVRGSDGESIFVGRFFFRKGDERAMETFIVAKYPEMESVEFLDEAAHFGRMYGGQ